VRQFDGRFPGTSLHFAHSAERKVPHSKQKARWVSRACWKVRMF